MTTQPNRRVPLSRDRVLRTAMCLADEGGIGSLSMRKLGQALGVEAMSLYNHVANKDDLLDGMTDLVLSEFELPSPGDEWETAVRRCAVSGHTVLVRHPWACNLIMSSKRIRPARLQYMESLLKCLREAGFSAEETSHAYHAIDSHILGFTLWQLGHVMPSDAPHITTKEEIAFFLATLVPSFSPGDYRYLIEHAEQHHVSRASNTGESEFEFGLRLILDELTRMRGTT